MKLRNKRTGEVVVEINKIGLVWNKYGMPAEIGQYDSIAELNENWEDYEPKEPLIKDEKIRKVVKAWAEANNAKVVFICALSGGWGVRHDWEDDGEYYSIDLLFKGDAPLGVGNQYTIAELCGEEEE